MSDKIKVLHIDDSAVVRGILHRIVTAEDDMEMILAAHNGEVGLASYKKHMPDIVILDIEMPVMDGITALAKILEFDPDAKVVMCSTLSTHNAEITLKAMSIGALDCIAKPTTATEMTSDTVSFKDTLIRTVRNLGRLRSSRPIATRNDVPKSMSITPSVRADTQARIKSRLEKPTAKFMLGGKAFSLRPYKEVKPIKLLAIGSSTGGPQALFKAIAPLKDRLTVPLVITQHMPPKFTKMLADHINTQTGVHCVEGEEGMLLEAGKAIIAPGGYHMLLKEKDGKVVVTLNEGPPENFCKPAVDPMLRSAFAIYGRNMAVAILTGMGSDGKLACASLVENGVHLVAQDEMTSTVWGMPGAVAEAGLCHAVKPIDEIGDYLGNLLK